jgi:hypothetical protein
MASHVKTVIALMTLPAFVLIHGAVSILVFGLAFGFFEAGETSIATAFGILSMILTPFLTLTNWLTPPLPDSVTLPVGILCSSFFWWLVSLKFILSKIEAQADRKTEAEKEREGASR